MFNGLFHIREPKNEPVLGYGLGTKERAGLKAELQRMLDNPVEVPCIIGGREVTTGDLVEAIYHGAVKRIRPKMMTVVTTICGLLPIMFGMGTGSDVMKRIAAPMVGGLVTSMLLELAIYPVIYYICPQLWAWGQHRVKKIKKFVNLPLVIFKFEEEFYDRFGVSAKFVGHPLVEEISVNNNPADFCRKHSLDPGKKIIAFLPGSRLNEVRKILPELVKVAELNQNHQEFVFYPHMEWNHPHRCTLLLR